MDACIISRPNKGKLAVFIATRSCSAAEIQQQAILAAPLNGSDDLNKPDDSRRWNHTYIMWIRLLFGVSAVLVAIAVSKYYL
jgi:hypothetical protein